MNSKLSKPDRTVVQYRIGDMTISGNGAQGSTVAVSSNKALEHIEKAAEKGVFQNDVGPNETKYGEAANKEDIRNN